MSGEDGRLVKRSVTIAGHATSISLEGIFWRLLKAEAAARGVSLAALIREIDTRRLGPDGGGNLSSAIRVFVAVTLERRPQGAG